MKVTVHVTVEAGRQQQAKPAQSAMQARKFSSRNDYYIFFGVIILAVLSVVALAFKGP